MSASLVNADLKIRAISESALEAILALLFEEAKDVRVETFPSGDGPGYTPRVVAGRMVGAPKYRSPTPDKRDINGRPTARGSS